MDPQTTPPALPPLEPPQAPVSAPTSSPAASDPLMQPAQPVEPTVAPRQQAIERLKSATNVLVTVGTSPSVDELSSALGLTLLLDKLGKHATTVFSGEIPRAIEFLNPEATFEENVDSLRDFIIALDKEKADKLRYKVEEDVVRIFITPYKTKIDEKDLQFSQGDFNVDVVVALGVMKRDDLDKAITAHGRILHDATVIAVNAGEAKSNLGSIDWHDPKASSVAEMLMSASESFGSGLLDAQISTAYLTGIVAATNRFSNEKTSPKVMTMAAQLMAAGANQQLIASNLRQDGVLSESIKKPSDDHATESEMVVTHTPEKSEKKPDSEQKLKNGPSKLPGGQTGTPQKQQNNQKSSPTKKADQSKDLRPEKSPPVSFPPSPQKDVTEPEKKQDSIELSDDLKQQLGAATDATEVKKPAETPLPTLGEVKVEPAPKEEPLPSLEDAAKALAQPEPPSFNATMAQTEAEKKAAEQSNNTSVNSSFAPPSLSPSPETPPVPASSLEASAPTSAPKEESQEDALAQARKAVESAAESQPFDPANRPLESLGTTPLPALDHSDTTQTEDLPALSTTSTDQLPTIQLPTQPTLSSEPQGGVDSGVSQMQSSGAFSSTAIDSADASSLQSEETSPDPMQGFMSAHGNSTIQPIGSPSGLGDGTPTDSGAPVPPPPPLPNTEAASGSLPPLPPLPPLGQPTDVASTFQPDVQPAFMQNAPATQNSWTQAADDLSAKKQQEEQSRQAKLDQMSNQYDAAVDRNRELQGLPPVNDDHSTFPLPPPPPTT